MCHTANQIFDVLGFCKLSCSVAFGIPHRDVSVVSQQHQHYLLCIITNVSATQFVILSCQDII